MPSLEAALLCGLLAALVSPVQAQVLGEVSFGGLGGVGRVEIEHELSEPLSLPEVAMCFEVAGARDLIPGWLDAYETYLGRWLEARARVDAECFALEDAAGDARRIPLFELDPPARELGAAAARERERVEDALFADCAASVDDSCRARVEAARQVWQLRRAMLRQSADDRSTLLGVTASSILLRDIDGVILRVAEGDAAALARAEVALAPLRPALVRALERRSEADAMALHEARSMYEARCAQLRASGVQVADEPTLESEDDPIARRRLRGLCAPTVEWVRLQWRALNEAAAAMGGEPGRRLMECAVEFFGPFHRSGSPEEAALDVAEILGAPTTTAQQRACVLETWMRWRTRRIERMRALCDQACRALPQECDGGSWSVVQLLEAHFQGLDPEYNERLKEALRACGVEWSADGVSRTDLELKRLEERPEWRAELVGAVPGLQQATRVLLGGDEAGSGPSAESLDRLFDELSAPPPGPESVDPRILLLGTKRQRFADFLRDERAVTRVEDELVRVLADNPLAVLRMSLAMKRWRDCSNASILRVAEAELATPAPDAARDRGRLSTLRARDERFQRALQRVLIERLRAGLPADALARSRSFRALEHGWTRDDAEVSLAAPR